MPAYDNPVRKIQTRKIAENAAGPDIACSWVLVKGKFTGINEGDETIEFPAFTKLEISNPKFIKAIGGACEIVVGS